MRPVRFVALFSILLPLAASAAPLSAFPDVVSTYPYAMAIRELALTGVVKGKPDGNFHPQNPINRADLVILVSRALNGAPAPREKICGKDVVAGSYYEAAFCAAVDQGFIGGYPDGTFKPGNTVTRAEAVKIVETMMEFDLSLRALKDFTPPAFDDVHAGDWYANYVMAAYKYQILPMIGWEGTAFLPGTPLSRGEAAGLISSALKAREATLAPQNQQHPDQGSGSSAGTESGTQTAIEKREEQRVQLAANDAKEAAKKSDLLMTAIPFADTRAGQTNTYQFTLPKKAVLSIDVKSDMKGKVDCVLSRIGTDGFSVEFYQGYSEAGHCALLVSVLDGTYQLRVSAADPVNFQINASAGQGSGNDGFSEAKSLDAKNVRTDFLDASDYQNFYTFTVPTLKADQAGISMKVAVASDQGLICTIFPLANVTLPSFEEPSCGATYAYPTGTYIVVVSRDPAKTPKGTRQTYAVELLK